MKTRFFSALATVVAVALMACPAFGDIELTDAGSIIGAGSSSNVGPTGGYLIVPGIGNAGGFFLGGGPFVDSTFDGALEVVGDDLGGGSVESLDTVTVNGDGTINLLLTLTSTSGDFGPGGLLDGGGVPLDTIGLFVGVNGGGTPIDFGTETVNSALLTATSSTGVDILGPTDLVALGFDVQSGSFGVSFGAGTTGLGINQITLDINVTQATAIPEPTSIALLGVIGMGLVVRRRR